jgi:hypothetical protein
MSIGNSIFPFLWMVKPSFAHFVLKHMGIQGGKSLLDGAVSGLSGEHNEKPLRPMMLVIGMKG